MALKFTEKVLWTLKSLEKKGKSQDVIRVVAWNGGTPVLEKRNYFSVNDDWQMGKARGFTYEEFKILSSREVRIKIKKLLLVKEKKSRAR